MLTEEPIGAEQALEQLVMAPRAQRTHAAVTRFQRRVKAELVARLILTLAVIKIQKEMVN